MNENNMNGGVHVFRSVLNILVLMREKIHLSSMHMTFRRSFLKAWMKMS